MKTFTIFFIILFNLSVLNLQAQNPPKLVDMSSKIPISGTQGNLTDVQVIENNVWITSSNPANIFRSIDNGNTFTSPTTLYGIQAIFMFSDASNGWAVGSSYGYKTIDGGQVWTRQTIGGTLQDVYFPTSLVGYAVDASGAIYKTENGGISWLPKTTVLLDAEVASVYFPNTFDPNTGYICIANSTSTLYKTTNGGTTWTNIVLDGIGSNNLNCLEFIDANTGWAVGGNGNIFSYKNGTWTKQSSPVTTSLNGISFASDGLNGWAVGDGGVILHTTNGGTTWTQEGSGITTQILIKVEVVSSTEAYIVGNGKTFIKYTTDYGTTGINPGLVSPAGFEVYPNPGNGRFNLRIPVGQQLHTITVVSISGKTVRSLDVSGQDSGFTLDLSGLPSGIYLLRCSTSKGLVCKKLVKR